ncbi:thiol reductant ABC exporter subunit CydC [Pontibacillus sp. ALD_SL1]|uniref:thiol reductant ABC exporter subunit CydC n=1 Tax=Pontibacillus sp. ALD_SL1 TaxID=2777185 RepID=UPI001A96A96C|nr:thiol reductant ABC exporter subunit CydC [Pontibacillus sp. ALD_SL1]QSS98737.1 thiol reductant ABC exporter subunit CydC [Pontibacillus sp. ALD_SL1]
MKQNGWIMPYIKENKRLLSVVVLLGILTVFSAAFLMFTSGYLISKAATRPENLLMIYIPIVAVRTFGIGRAVVRYIERLVGHDVVLRILSKMRLRVYKIIEPQVLVPSSKFKTGEVLGILADDVEKLQDVYLKTVFPSLVGLSLYSISVVSLSMFSWPFALLMAIYAGVLVFLFPYVSLLVTKAHVQREKSGLHQLYQSLTDAVLGISDWQFSGRQSDFIKEYERKEEELLQIEQKRARFTRWRNSIGQLIIGVMLISMMAWTFSASTSGSIPYTFIAAFVLVLFPLTEAFLPLSDAISETPAYEDSIQRLSKLSSGGTEESGKVHVPYKGGEVTLKVENLFYSYDEIDVGLKNLSFMLKPGEKIALLGPSGAGKSTLLKVIEGVLAPESGSVRVNGVEASAYYNLLSEWISVLNQNPHLFDTTIANNIRLGNPEASDEEVYWAAELVQLHDYILTLPEGYNTPIHESGVKLSGGQRQRIALARILLQQTPIVLLDEPCVGLDPKTEKALMETIFKVLEGKSILWVTHHLAHVEEADSVLFLDRGEIAMEGTHESLLESSERYRRLYELDRPFVVSSGPEGQVPCPVHA